MVVALTLVMSNVSGDNVFGALLFPTTSAVHLNQTTAFTASTQGFDGYAHLKPEATKH